MIAARVAVAVLVVGLLSVQLWYPATPIPGAAATSYLPPGWDQALNSGGGIGAGSTTSPTPHRATSTRTR